MPYPEMMVKPMREDVTRYGITELRTIDDVDNALGNLQGTAMVFVNSVCGCAAGGARPALGMALTDNDAKPDNLYTVFAGQDIDATSRARSYFGEYQPSSPSIAFLKDGEVVQFIHRHQIEGTAPDELATMIRDAFVATV